MTRSVGVLAWMALVVVLSACGSDRPDYYLDPDTDSPRVEGPVTRDPALETPADPVWQNYWLPVINPGRDAKPSTRLMDDLVAPRPGMRIADIGAGGGYFSFRYARLVGDTGFVHAIDIDRRMTRKVAYEAQLRGVTNVEPMQVPEGRLGLQPASVDLVTFIETSAFATCRREDSARYVSASADALRPGGRLLVYNESTPGQADLDCPPLSGDEVVALASARFSLQRRETVTKGDWGAYALLFERLP